MAREPKDPWTGHGQFTRLTPEELKAKCPRANAVGEMSNGYEMSQQS